MPAAPAFTGLVAYPITPLHSDGTPDLDGVEQLVARAVAAGVDGITVLATSGAGVSFDTAERRSVVTAAVSAAGGQVPVYAGISAASAHHVLRNAIDAVEAGADGLVLAPFSYLPLSEPEVRALFATVHQAVPGVPLCFYNKPVQLGFDVTPETLAWLVENAGVVAVKDPAVLPSRPNPRLAELGAVGLRSVGLSGDVALLTDAPAADAWHTGVAALAPAEYLAVRRARIAGDGSAEAQRTWLLELTRAIAAMPVLAGLHAAAQLLGTPTAPPRDSLIPATEADVEGLAEIVLRRP